MFAIINTKTNKIVMDNGSKLPDEKRPIICIFEQEEHANEYHKLTLLNLTDYAVSPITSITWE